MENADVFNKIANSMINSQIEKEERSFLRKNKLSINLFCTIFVYYQVNAYIFSITERMDTTS